MDISSLVDIKKNDKIPEIAPGDTVRVSTKIVEGDKERIQVFQGVVIKIRRGGNSASYTVRHVAFGIGVERTFLLTSPMVEKVEIVREGKVRRAKLYYLRGLSGKEARRKIKRVERKAKQVGEELLQQQPEEVVEPIMDEAAVAAAAEKEAAEKAAAEKATAAQLAAKAPEAVKTVEAVKAPKAVKAPEAVKTVETTKTVEAVKAPKAVKAPEAVKELKKETAAEKPAEKAPVAEKKEKAEKPAEPAKDEKKEAA